MFPEFEWNNEYSVGHPLLDKQHRKLLSLCNQARDCANDDRGDFHKVLNDIAHYGFSHFESEESVLKECNFAGLEGHEIDHQDFMMRIMDFLSESMAKKVDKEAFADFALAWWKNHVLISDMEYRSAVLKISSPI
jgi:hemerythrin